MRLANHGRRSSTRRSAPIAEINIIPLVDVVLVLLIIFMATTAFVRDSAISMKLPSARSSQPANLAQDINIALAQNGALFLDGKPSSENKISQTFTTRAQRNPQTRVVIKADENIAYARVVRIMDLARQAGLPRVALGTRTTE